MNKFKIINKIIKIIPIKLNVNENPFAKYSRDPISDPFKLQSLDRLLYTLYKFGCVQGIK
jgi:hypothetical protein